MTRPGLLLEEAALPGVTGIFGLASMDVVYPT